MPPSLLSSTELLVKFRPEVKQEVRENTIKDIGGEIIEYIKALDVFRIKISEDKSIQEWIELYNSEPNIEYAEPNRIYRINK